MKTKLIAMTLALGMAGCASSSYTYHVEPTPLVAGQSKYLLGDVNVSLIEGHGAPTASSLYMDEKTLTKEFSDALKKHMKEQNVLASSAESADGSINVDINFTRTFHISGNALAKPQIGHSITVKKDNQLLASVTKAPYKTKYAYFEELAVNTEIAVGSWDEEDEPKDVDLVSKLIINDVAKMGNP